MKQQQTPFVLSILAGLAFFISFSVPFVCSNFTLETKVFDTSSQVVEDPCLAIFAILLPQMSDILPDWAQNKISTTVAQQVCEGYANDKIQQYTYKQLDAYLGAFEMPPDNEKVDWEECITIEQDDPVSDTLCCEPEDEELTPFKACVKFWISSQAKIPLGEQTIWSVIRTLFKTGETRIAILILVFSIVFPMTKIALALRCSRANPDPKMLQFLQLTSKWSMVDVFVVGLIIAFFQSKEFSFGFTAEIGVYLFAAGALLSSVAIILIEKNQPADSSSPPRRPPTDPRYHRRM